MRHRLVALIVVMLLIGSACGSSSESSADGGDDTAGSVQDQETPAASGIPNTGSTDDAPENSSGTEATETGSDAEASVDGGSFDRDSFVLCSVIEEHKDELAAIVGFVVDPERGVETFDSECNIRGSDPGEFARVLLVPAFTPSIAFHAEGYEGSQMPVPELGSEAVFIESDFQPHVVFLLGDLIIDVDVEVLPTASREVMIEYALRVRELLAEENS